MTLAQNSTASMTDTEKLIEELVSDRQKFNEFVYTPVDIATKELSERQNRSDLKEYVDKNLPAGVPSRMLGKQHAVLFRHIATPNYELRRFFNLIDGLEGLTPLFFEYGDDKYTDNNESKYFLGKMGFFHGRGKRGGEKITRLKVIDFQISRGIPINRVKTLWGQNLIDFHHDLFKQAYENKVDDSLFYDASNWFHVSGGNAQNYYENFLKLFLRNGILFENFLPNGKEEEFTKNIFLPSFIKVLQESGTKPLVIALTPTEIESSIFWFCHPGGSENGVMSKIKVV